MSDDGEENNRGKRENVSFPHAQSNVVSNLDGNTLLNDSLVQQSCSPTESKEDVKTEYDSFVDAPVIPLTEKFDDNYSQPVSTVNPRDDSIKCEMDVLPASSLTSVCNRKVIHGEKVDNDRVKIVRDWLLMPVLSQDSDFEGDGDDFIDTLLHIAEDKMYLYGFYERLGQTELVTTRRINNRKRSRGSNGISHATGNQGAQAPVMATSPPQVLPFSFVNWLPNSGKGRCDPERVHQQTISSDAILCSGEKYTLCRYALSSGKLRKECADPYQFLTAKLQEIRHCMEEELMGDAKNSNEKKTGVTDY
ncbi:hypothetical protein, conserved [Trypanosoma brucei brucei TREU927]|uniref:Uncharacterized protein n=1 Tax=Trypanosoma brucei brucei (strain 927/4 GUTat10.1) TaxID=185431 RepID=Q57WX2_TRYB2|nr:hypothetical protein, conserved [Trypanosoma brucei brucei TREU927]AAX69895.1 hypothetical protein, conserved [Trypanosoma brucei]AAZ10126.1 hypothetical protein, conserved [Trypanosoma brucei brucei TREU927]